MSAHPAVAESDAADGRGGGSPIELEVIDVEKEFLTSDGQLVRALGPISLQIPRGGFAAIIGRSGCGKSTLFNVVAGLLEPDRGEVRVAGRDTTGKPGVVAYQLQKDLLLGWRTVLGNVVLGPEIRGGGRDARPHALKLLEQYGLGDFANSYPSQLSGGMRQRAAFIRTLLFDRDVILLDEPFGALDAQTRLNMQEWLMARCAELDNTILLTTHDVEEAIFLADRVYALSPRPGRVKLAVDVPASRPRPRDILDEPEMVKLKHQLLRALHED